MQDEVQEGTQTMGHVIFYKPNEDAILGEVSIFFIMQCLCFDTLYLQFLSDDPVSLTSIPVTVASRGITTLSRNMSSGLQG